MLSRDDRPGRWEEAGETEDLEASIAKLAARIREVAQLVRAIAPVVSELQALQEASAELRAINLTGYQQAISDSAGQVQPPSLGANVTEAPLPRLLTPRLIPGDEAPASSADRSNQVGVVRVTVARLNGPLEPVRIRRGLATLAGVRDVALVNRAQNRLTVALDTDQPPDQLPIAEALAMVFDQDVQGEWTGEGEFLAVIEGAPEASGHT